MTPILELQGVSQTFTLPGGAPLPLLRDLDLAIAPGAVVAIVGRSGSGKSTLLHLLGLLEPPTSGTVRVAGVEVATLSDAGRARLRGETLGFIFQQFHLLARRTAWENVAEPLLYGPPRALGQRQRRAAALLAQVGLAERAGARPSRLSGGEQQRVAIARAVVRGPRVVLADEPTGALDAVTGAQVLDLLLQLVRAEGVAVVLVTHDAAVAGRAERVLELADGTLRERG